MERILLDTDILSEILKGKDQQVKLHADAYARVFGRYTISAVSVQEVLFGLHTKDAYRQIQIAEALFGRNDIVTPVLEDYKVVGEVRGRARRQGKQLTSDDCLIGVIASRLGLPVATGNTKHFQAMISAGLELELRNWRSRPPLS